MLALATDWNLGQMAALHGKHQAWMSCLEKLEAQELNGSFATNAILDLG